MSQEPSAPADAPVEGQAPEDASGQGPETESTSEKTFGEEYVKKLRKEAAAARTELASVKTELDKLASANKSETEQATERAAKSERRAIEAEAKLLRFEVAAERNFDANLALAMHGDTREEIEKSADAIATALAAKAAEIEAKQPRMPGLDGGARKTPEQTKSPEQGHNDFLLGVLGKTNRP